MPFAVHENARLFWRVDGDASKPPALLLNSLGTDTASWDRAMLYLLPHLRVIRMDARGHGASDAPAGEYSLELLAADAIAVLDAANVTSAVVCGVSLGGMIGIMLASTAPHRMSALIAACTSPHMDGDAWRARIDAVRSGGMVAIAEMALGRFFSPGFAASHPEVVGSFRSGLLEMSGAGYAACSAAIRDMDLRPRLASINRPTLVIGGTRDVSTPFAENGRLIAEAVPGAAVSLLDAPHLAQVEAPSAFAASVLHFLRGLDRGSSEADASRTLYEAGLETRRHVLGDAWVDRSLASRTPFNADFQAMITRIAWHEVWNRPGLDHRTRRLLVLGITAALGHWEEFGLHVKAGLEQKGFDETELREALIQLAIYAGVPAANTAFSEAGKIIADLQNPTGS
jgi:3-oxoadipate enol-lactonase/4-carboxymuconolactone decarboxylase